jgi:hypothetical protein
MRVRPTVASSRRHLRTFPTGTPAAPSPLGSERSEVDGPYIGIVDLFHRAVYYRRACLQAL